MSNGQRILVVDEVSDTEDVLRAVLEPRGLQVDRVRGPVANRDAGGIARPDVVVIDTDDAPACRVQSEAWRSVPQVIIGTASWPDSPDEAAHADRRFLRKPFQYAELIQAIESLIERKAA